ncbi:MAG TPA: TerC family protein [Burkholderiaceae bacterium]|nr:TerC family protein [Burkholderiaceae bacterium]
MIEQVGGRPSFDRASHAVDRRAQLALGIAACAGADDEAQERHGKPRENPESAVMHHRVRRSSLDPENMMLDWLLTPEALVAVVTLTALELVLGIDNVIFIAILAGKLPPHQQDRARLIGLTLAAFGRIALLFSIVWIMGLTAELFSIFGNSISWRDLILIAGGLFLIYKAVGELHQRLEGDADVKGATVRASFAAVLAQVALLDVVFALDSIITAIGMVRDIRIMAVAIILSVILMMVVSGYVHRFVSRHPTIKVLALSFLMMIGLVLIAEGFDVEVPKGYVYFAMGFAVFVELLNMRLRKVSQPVVTLHEAYVKSEPSKSEGRRE